MNSNILFLFVFFINAFADKINTDHLKNYSEFLNFGEKKNKLNKENLENDIFKSKIDVLGKIFKVNVDSLKLNKKLDVVFLVDASSSVGSKNFKSEIKFVKKLLSDITVDYNHTRIALVTFSSSNAVNIDIDEISYPSKENNKCLLLNKQLNNITYKGGGTYTLGAFEAAKKILKNSRRNSTKQAVFLITDGYSNGGDPVPVSNELKANQVVVFTIGVRNGNYKELYDLSSSPGELHSYLLDSFEEFESLARRALHADLKSGDYVPLGISTPCDKLCKEGNCCDANAICSCGTTTGHYSCICELGYYGSGLKDSCFPCINGTYSDGLNTCLPCPDINHFTKVPAIGIESCTCKSGFRNSATFKCEAIQCPKIHIPTNGYLVKKRECGIVVNNACGIRCEVGYSLIGSSIRLCQANATWSGTTPTCEVKTCSPLPTPHHGSMKCSHSDLDINLNSTEGLPVDTVCTFECDKGKHLIGSKQRTCLPLARWDGLKTLCKPIKCGKLPPIKYGKYEPKSCSFGKQEFGKKCKIVCDDGFKIKGEAEKICNGVWKNETENSICTDGTPPNLTCPLNITSDSLPGKKYGHTSWEPPNVTDNSDLEVSIWMKPAIKNITNFKFAIGSTAVHYFAQDAFQNVANCTFYVNILDVEKPTFENCIDPATFLTAEKYGANITWDEPTAYDNSQNVTVSSTHTFGNFSLGVTTITYTATDPSNNTNICKINITVEESKCEALSDPLFGSSECTDHSNGIQCVITCQEGYAIPSTQNIDDNSISLFCNQTTPTWSFDNNNLYPECSVTKTFDTTEDTGVLNITSTEEDVCNNTEKMNEIKNDITVSLNEGVCNGNCTINMDVNCERETEELEEMSNIIKRDVGYVSKIKDKNPINRISINFEVKGKHLSNKNITSIRFRNQNVTIHSHRRKRKCPSGYVPKKNICVQCLKGTFLNSTTNKCENCPLGTYNDQTGQLSCKSCPENFSTRKMRSKKLSHCLQKCPPGTHAKKRIVKYHKYHQNFSYERASLSPYCKSCNIGYFQPNYGELGCLPCPKGYTTTGYHSTSIQQCVKVEEICSTRESSCNNGACVIQSEYHYTCNCYPNFVGTFCEKRISICDSSPCWNGATCIAIKNETDFVCSCSQKYTGKFCEREKPICGKSCFNNGTCMESDEGDYCLCKEGFGGEFCEIQETFCFEGICENNGTCMEGKNSYQCLCSGGFIGKRCHLLPCDYKPCPENSLCINLIETNTTKDSFVCQCPDGYTGDSCAEKIDHCHLNPCKNGGVCINELVGYKCSCPKLFKGDTCEIIKSTRHILDFPQYDINDFVRLKGFSKNLTEISTCLWMETLDDFNYGTLLSYATKKFDNGFTLTDYTGLILYVNNEYAVTDIFLNDGYWHHLCVTWQSLNGSYAVYVDGEKVKYGDKLGAGHVIEGNGNLIIGQEQDIMGGRFSQSESFMGKMAYIDIWSTVLSEKQIVNHFSDCNDSQLGDLYAWPEILDQVQENVKVINSTFCQNCKSPKPLYNGMIEVVNNTAFYTCTTGFELDNNIYLNGRRCTKTSEWEGVHEPYCKSIYCGYPNYVKNSMLLGNQFYYNDEVQYKCYDGFILKGSSRVVCSENGKWMPESPKCEGLQCTAFSLSKHSEITILSENQKNDFIENITKLDLGTQIEVRCLRNAKLEGESLLTCLETGLWDFQPPKCISNEPSSKLDCSLDLLPQPPENGYYDETTLNNTKNGSSNFVTFACRPGYKLIGDNVTTCIIDGYWTELNTTCEPVTCPKPETPRNMKLKYKEEDKSIYISGNKITFECIPGHTLLNNKEMRCLATGKWSMFNGICMKKSCYKPDVSDDTDVVANSYLFGENITIKCSSGFSYGWYCNEDGIWEGESDLSC